MTIEKENRLLFGLIKKTEPLSTDTKIKFESARFKNRYYPFSIYLAYKRLEVKSQNEVVIDEKTFYLSKAGTMYLVDEKSPKSYHEEEINKTKVRIARSRLPKILRGLKETRVVWKPSNIS